MANIELEYPDAMSFLLEGKARYRVAYGGRGSSKSWSAARALLILAMKSKIRILCAREVQRSIKDSVHRLLSDQIEAMGIGAYFEILQNEIKCTRTGSHFIFAGLANTTAESLKSIENVKVCWVEEAQTVSDRSWEILIPTIRASGSEIWVTFNPSETTDPTYVRFITHPPPDAIVRRVNWYDNPWFPEELKKEKDYLYSVDPEAAAHVWGGECRKFGDAQVLRGKYSVETFEPRDYWDGPYQGADWGFAVDPSTLVRVWIWERKLYVEYEAYGLGTEIDHTPALFDGIPEARAYVTRADSARPETISYMVRNGWPKMEPVYKWKGSIEDGVQYLRAFDQIIIHPRCPHTAEEARLWSFKTDKLSGDILPELLDKHNHMWDAIRYSLTPMILGHAKKNPRQPAIDEEFPGMYRGEYGSTWMA